MSEFRILDYNYVFDSSVSLTASTADSAFPVSNLRNFQRGRVWRTTSSSAQSLIMDLKTAEEIDTALLIFEKDSVLTFHTGQTIKIQANATNEWSSPAVDETLSLDESFGVMSFFWSTAQEYRYWRLYMDDPLNGFGYFEVPKLFLGKALQLTQPPSIGFSLSEDDQSNISKTDYGVEYSDVYPGRRDLSLRYVALTDADRDSLRQVYERLGKVKPLVVSLDRLETTFLDKDEYIFYGYLDNNYNATQVFYNFFDVNLQLREAL